MKTFLSRSIALLIVIFVILFVVTTAISSNATDPALEKSYPQVGIQKCWEAYDKVVFPLGWMQSQWEDWQIENVETATVSEITSAIAFPIFTLAVLTTLIVISTVLLYRFVGWLANLFTPVANSQTNEQGQNRKQVNRETVGGNAEVLTPTPGGPRITWPAVGLVAVLAVVAIGAVFLSRESIWLPQVIHRQAERLKSPTEVIIDNKQATDKLRALAAEIRIGGSVSEPEIETNLSRAASSLAELQTLRDTAIVSGTMLSAVNKAIAETEKLLTELESTDGFKIQPRRSWWQGIWSWLRWVLLVGVAVLVIGIAFGVIQFQGAGPAATGRYPRTQC